MLLVVCPLNGTIRLFVQYGPTYGINARNSPPIINAITSIMPRHPHTPYAPQHKSRRRIGIALTCGDSQQHRRAAAIFYYLKLFQIISPIFQFIQLILHVSTAPTAFGTCLAVCLSWQIYWVSVNWIVKFVNPVSCALLRLIGFIWLIFFIDIPSHP